MTRRRWQRGSGTRTTTAARRRSSATVAIPAAGRWWSALAATARVGIRTAGIVLDVHLFEARVTPTVRVFFFRFEQLFVPGFVREGSGLAHHVVDFLALAGRVARVGNPYVAGLPVHAQLAAAATARR